MLTQFAVAYMIGLQNKIDSLEVGMGNATPKPQLSWEGFLKFMGGQVNAYYFESADQKLYYLEDVHRYLQRKGCVD